MLSLSLLLRREGLMWTTIVDDEMMTDSGCRSGVEMELTDRDARMNCERVQDGVGHRLLGLSNPA